MTEIKYTRCVVCGKAIDKGVLTCSILCKAELDAAVVRSAAWEAAGRAAWAAVEEAEHDHYDSGQEED